MRWPEDAEGWPGAERSRFVLCRPHRWHVQEAGEGPLLLLVHGAGGATQSWRGLMPVLARSHRVVAIDLPGQGFTQLGARGRCGLDEMAQDLGTLAAAENWRPGAIIGHSAGAAIALRMAEDMDVPPAIVGINAALMNFSGMAGWLFPFFAKLLSVSPFSADLFVATSSSARNVARLIEGTGSRLDARGLELYRRLASDRAHVDATLAMMSQWQLGPLMTRLPRLAAPVLLLVGEADRAVPPRVSEEAAARLPDAGLLRLPGLGHLAHEEAPEAVAEAILPWLADRLGASGTSQRAPRT